MFIISLYCIAIAAVEISGAFVSPVIVVLCHSILTLILLSHYVLQAEAPYRVPFPALILLPLLRIFSFTMPLPYAPQAYWYALVGLPLLFATFLAIRTLGLRWSDLGGKLNSLPTQILIGLHGLPLSLAAYLYFQPQIPDDVFSWLEMVITALSLIIFSAFTEELIFRGVLQRVLSEMFGPAGIVLSAILFASMYSGTLAWGYVLFVGLMGLFFGWSVARTGSIWGSVMAHAIFKVGFLLVWPSG